MATIGTTAGRFGFEDSEVERLGLPGLDGFALAEALRHDEATRTVPVLLPRDETGVADRMRAYAFGVAGFVVKPFEPGALVALLSVVIERAAAS
jgi:DNA-binding response OmpR family regulator